MKTHPPISRTHLTRPLIPKDFAHLSLSQFRQRRASKVVVPAQTVQTLICASRMRKKLSQCVAREEFERLQTLTGKTFSLDAMADESGNNALCTQYCHKANSFLKFNASGHHVWINPPYCLLDTFLKHYLKCKRTRPSDTSACIVVPAWPGKFRKHLHGMTLLQEYPVGTNLFNSINPSGTQKQTKPLQYPVQVWYDAPGPKPLTPTLHHTSGHITMHVSGHINGCPARILVDSGASTSFINTNFALKHNLNIHPASLDTVQMANGNCQKPLGYLHGTITAQAFKCPVYLTAMDLTDAYDVILGDDWCTQYKACLDYATCSIRVQTSNRKYTLRTNLTNPSTNPLMSATQLIKSLHNEEDQVFLAIIKPLSGDSAPTLPPNPNLIPNQPLLNLLDEYKDVFAPLTGLPPERDVSHTIPLTDPNIKPPYRPPYRLSPREMEEARTQIDDLLAKGYIVPSTSPYGAPILFVKKPRSDKLRMCIDFRALNRITIKNRYPLPRIDDLLDRLHGATIFSSLDLQSGYHQIRLSPEDQHRCAFTSPFGHYEMRVLAFGLANAPATFQSLMNNIFKDKINKYTLVYLDDLLVFSKTPEEHLIHLRDVLETLRQHKLFASPEKSTFNKPELLFLGHIISQDGIKVDPAKTKAITDWPTPTNLTQLRSFLGLANYFRRFLEKYSVMAKPLTDLTKLNTPWAWSPLCEEAFNKIKQALVTAPVLTAPDYSDGAPPFSIICDASCAGIGAVLLQGHRPIAYESRKLTPAEVNYTTTEQEMLSVIHALHTWRCYVEGIPFTIHTDHCPNTFFSTQPTLSRRQARWSEFLQQFNFEWVYKPGPQNTVADALSRQPILASIYNTSTTLNQPLLNTLLSVTQQPIAARPPIQWCVQHERFKFDWAYHPHRTLTPAHTIAVLTRHRTRML
ncbi:hypothetical protein Vretimale_14990, partial [Volvox reticuliferus]